MHYFLVVATGRFFLCNQINAEINVDSREPLSNPYDSHNYETSQTLFFFCVTSSTLLLTYFCF